MTAINMTAYDKAVSAAVFYRLPQSGYLQISGADRIDFLQRQTSNDLRSLLPDRALLTVLTSPTARILDVFYLIMHAEHIDAVTLPGLAEPTTRFLQSRIFFMDKVTVENASDMYTQIDLLGPNVEQVLKFLGFAERFDTNHVSTAELAETQIVLLPMEPSLALGYRLLVPFESGPDLEQALSDYGCASLDDLTYEALRIEAGLPKVGNELRQDFTPLETGLAIAVSDSKGCYTGQEVIARQITYDKVTQALCGLRLQSEAAQGMRLWAGDKAAGELTSCVNSPQYGWIGLGIVKRPNNQPGSLLSVGNNAQSGMTARTVTLPFVDD